MSRFRRVLLFAMALSLFAASVSRADSKDDNGTRLFEQIVKEFNPETLQMRLVSLPKDDGTIPYMYLNAKGVDADGMRLDSVEIEGYNVEVNHPSEWDSKGVDVVNILSANGTAVLLEKDVNDNLQTKSFGKNEKWTNIKFSFNDGDVFASAYYKADLKIFRATIKVDLTGRFVPKNGSEIWLDDVHLSLNTAQVPDSLVRSALNRIQPLIRLDRLMLPMEIDRIELEEGKATIYSKRPPRPYGSIVYNYTRPAKGQ